MKQQPSDDNDPLVSGHGCKPPLGLIITSQKRRWEQQQQEQVDDDYERGDKHGPDTMKIMVSPQEEPSWNSIADEIASYRPHPR